MYCTSCGKQIDNNEKFCPFCGAKMDDDAASVIQEDSQIVDFGNSELPAETQVIPTTQDPSHVDSVDEHKNEQAGNTPNSRNKKVIIGVVAGVVVVIVAVLLIVFMMGAGNENNDQPDQGSISQDESSIIDNDYAPATITGKTPFWGAFVLKTQNPSSLRVVDTRLKDDGFSSYYLDSSSWANLYPGEGPYMMLTAGMWETESEAEKTVEALKAKGYENAWVQYSGECLSPIKRELRLDATSATGQALAGVVKRDEDGYVLKDSSDRVYSESEIRAMRLDDASLCIAWNEPFARLGYHFKNPSLQAYFEGCDWYHDTHWSGSLSGAAAANNSLLRDMAGNSPWKDLASS